MPTQLFRAADAKVQLISIPQNLNATFFWKKCTHKDRKCEKWQAQMAKTGPESPKSRKRPHENRHPGPTTKNSWLNCRKSWANCLNCRAERNDERLEQRVETDGEKGKGRRKKMRNCFFILNLFESTIIRKRIRVNSLYKMSKLSITVSLICV